MGLAAVKTRQKLGRDPRNTAWSNDTSRFGHQYLEKLGWQPGSGLGMVSHATTTHIKVSIKDDNVGLGSKLRRKEKKDEFDSGECAGLDAFQRLLGRLNGNEDSVTDELERQKKEEIINGKWGINFVKGDVLASTWDSETRTLKSYSSHTKRKHEDEEDDDSKSKRIKKSKKHKKESKVQSKKEKSNKKKKSSKSDKKEKKGRNKEKEAKIEDEDEKREKVLKKAKKSSKDHKRSKKDKSDKHSKSAKREKKSRSAEVSRESMLQPKASDTNVISSRLSARSKWIRQKRAAVMDAKALNEIFMVTS